MGNRVAVLANLEVRSRESSLRSSYHVVVGAVAGGLGAMVPTAFLDRPASAGLVGGALYGLYSATALAPFTLSVFVCLQVSGDAVSGMLRESYLYRAGFVVGRLGPIVAALREWLVLALASIAAGSVVGLGDGLRHGVAFGGLDNATSGLGLSLIVQGYLVVFAAMLCLTLRGMMLPLTVLLAMPISTPLAAALSSAEWWRLMVKMTPYGPLWSLVTDRIAGRFQLPMDSWERFLVASLWMALAVIVLLVCMRRSGLPVWTRLVP